MLLLKYLEAHFVYLGSGAERRDVAPARKALPKHMKAPSRTWAGRAFTRRHCDCRCGWGACDEPEGSEGLLPYLQGRQGGLD
ncbi:hypothetical protein GCM10027598_83400 [Amycolatopsis oliviviridis]